MKFHNLFSEKKKKKKKKKKNVINLSAAAAELAQKVVKVRSTFAVKIFIGKLAVVRANGNQNPR